MATGAGAVPASALSWSALQPAVDTTMPRPLFIALITTLALSTQVTAAPIYKWVDSDNRVHYEDTRPPTGTVEVIKPRVIYLGEPSDKTAPADLQAGDEAATRIAERQRMCTQSKERLAEAQAADRMYTLDEKGRRTYMAKDEIATHIAKLQEAVDSWCKEE